MRDLLEARRRLRSRLLVARRLLVRVVLQGQPAVRVWVRVWARVWARVLVRVSTLALTLTLTLTLASLRYARFSSDASAS